MNRILTCLAFVACFAFCVTGGTLQDFEAANRLYDQGKYAEAATAYQNLIQSGTDSAAVYFNLGNALLKSGQLGRALAIYRTLEASNPRDPDLRANLRFALSQVRGPTLQPRGAAQWLGRVSLNEWVIATSVAFWAALLLLAAGYLRPSVSRLLRPYEVTLASITVGLTACLFITFSAARTPKAIVVTTEAIVRQSPLEDAPTLFTVYDGAELQVLDHNNGWAQVSIDPRRAGWIRQDQVVGSRGSLFFR